MSRFPRLPMFCDPLPHARAKRAELAALGQLLFLRSLRAMGPHKTSEADDSETYRALQDDTKQIKNEIG